MPVYHIVLFKLKPAVTQQQLEDWRTLSSSMVGKIPGLQQIKLGAPLPISVPRAHGFDMGLVAILDKADDLKGYAEHPAHLEVHKTREALCTHTLAYDLEF